MSEHIRSRHIEKEYYAQLDGEITAEAITMLQQGLEIATRNTVYSTLPCAVRKLDPAPVVAERSRRIRDDRHGPTSWISITLTEGKFRQVRKMTAAVGFPTLRLIRVRVGEWTLQNLQVGEVQEISDLVPLL